MTLRSICFLVTTAWVLVAGAPRAGAAGEPVPAGAPPIIVVQAHGTEPGELKPRYQPVPPEERGWYNAGYMFAMTRGVARSTMVSAVKAPLFLLTIPLDVVLLPFTAIGGLFG